jgi:ankyrin repeat protein
VTVEDGVRELHFYYATSPKLVSPYRDPEAQEIWQSIRKEAQNQNVDRVVFRREEIRSGRLTSFWVERQPDGEWPQSMLSDCGDVPGPAFSTLFEAARWGRPEDVFAFIESGEDVNAPDEAGATPLLYAVSVGNSGTVFALIEAGAAVDVALDGDPWFCGETALMMAAGSGDSESLEALIQGGADVNKASFEGGTALGTAALRGFDDIVRRLIAAGAKVDASTHNGMTPLMIASEYGSGRAVCALLATGADVHRKDAQGEDALIHAISERERARKSGNHSLECYLESVHALLDAGASPRSRDSKGASALALAKRAGDRELANLLILCDRSRGAR